MKDKINIVSWNCNMAFRRKVQYILNEFTDVLVIQECECINKLNVDKWKIQPTAHYWYGNNLNKGIAIFTFNGFDIDLKYLKYNESFEFIIPMRIFNETHEFILYAVWTQKTYDGHYTRHIFNAVEYYRDEIISSKSIIIGDYNSNSIWDKTGRKTNHTNFVNMLFKMNLSSAYHCIRKEEQGKESTSTLYFQRKKDRGYHIDYCFMSNELLPNILSFTIGQYDEFIKYSDHMPLFLSLSFPCWRTN